jgi:hypothetical protein
MLISGAISFTSRLPCPTGWHHPFNLFGRLALQVPIRETLPPSCGRSRTNQVANSLVSGGNNGPVSINASLERIGEVVASQDRRPSCEQ